MKCLKHLAWILVLASASHATIITVNTMTEAQQYIEGYQEKDLLVACDTDLILRPPPHPATVYPAVAQYAEIYKAIIDDLTPEQKEHLLTVSLNQPYKLVENPSSKVIIDLTKKFEVIDFTIWPAMPTHVTRRLQALRDHGFNFSLLLDNMTFEDLPTSMGQYPTFKCGILFGNGDVNSKGEVFAAFLKKLKHLPKMVVVIDERLTKLEDIKTVLANQKIDVRFLGIEYRGGFYSQIKISADEFKKFWTDLANRVKTENSNVV